MDRLWAPWRIDYIKAPKSTDGCIFCDNPELDDEERLIVHRGKDAFVMLNLYPYNNGHVLVAPYDHLADMDNLPSKTRAEMLDLATLCMTVMRTEMKAEGFNFGANIGSAAGAGIAEHLHFHVVPRWAGDTNFMPVLGNTKVQIDGLRETRALLAEGMRRSTNEK